MSVPAVDQAQGVLLDFDGPVCRVFAGLPAAQAAADLRAALRDHGVELPRAAHESDDPLAVLTATSGAGACVTALADQLLRDIELAAVQVAEVTPGALEFLQHCRSRDVPVVIVTNNSAEAVRSFLARLRLDDLVLDVAGRPPRRPELMKPDPYLIDEALRRLGVAPAIAVFVGDSVTDVTAACRRHVPLVALANKPHKLASLHRAGAEHLITSMWQLLPGSSGPLGGT